MTTEAERTPSAVSMIAALLCLGAVPVGLVGFAIIVESVPEAWLEGGWANYAIVACAGISSMALAIGAYFLTRGSPVAAAFGLALSVLTMGIGAFGYREGLSGAFVAVRHAAPMDQGIIMNGSVGEVMACLILAACLVAGLFGSLGAASLVSALGSKSSRGALGLFGLGLLCLAAWQFGQAAVDNQTHDAFRAVSRGGAGEVGVLIIIALEEAQALRPFALAGLVGAAVAALLAVATVRGQPKVLALLLAGLALPAVAVGGLHLLGRPTPEQLELLSRPPLPFTLMPLAGIGVDPRDGYVRIAPDELFDDSGHALHDGDHLFPPEASATDPRNFYLEPKVTTVRLGSVLAQAYREGARDARLVGFDRVATSTNFTVPPSWEAQLTRPSGVQVVLANDATCRDGNCEFGVLDEKGLTIGGTVLPLETQSTELALDPVDVHGAIHLKIAGLTMDQLINAAHTAAKSRRFLAIHVD